ncbi:MAG: hypothetical protein QG664_291 [Patescibacteria group bacterium]|nr:hypothetical protein [Patescibacteria group bacterium]
MKTQWFVFKVVFITAMCRIMFDLSGGSENSEYFVYATFLLSWLLAWVLELLWSIDNNLKQILKREVPEVEE